MLRLDMPIFLTTTEVRWFSPGEIPTDVQSWFDGLGTPLVKPERTDLYLPRTAPGLGIKLREGRLEIKARLQVHGGREFSPGVSGMAESWVKWGVRFPAQFSGWIPVRKVRQILFYQVTEIGKVLPSIPGEMLDQGGGVELTQVWVGGEPWWTLGIEVFGPAGGREEVLMSIAGNFLRDSVIPGLDQSCSYAQLLADLKKENR